MHDPRSAALLGKTIDGRYHLASVLGHGGFSTVYRAEHTRLPRDFAVKVLHWQFSDDSDQVQRFRQEVRAVAGLHHSNIIDVLDFGQDPEVGWYLVLPLLDGETLDARRRRPGTMPIVDIHSVILQTAAALDAAHQVGIVHRDVKPENLFLTTDASREAGFCVKVLDFGIAKVRRPEHGTRLAGPRGRPDSGLACFGTPLFMAPEQILGDNADSRSDIYALGLVAYELLTGEVPHLASTREGLFQRRVEEEPPPPSSTRAGAWVPPALDGVVLRMLARDPARRPASMTEVIDLWLTAEAATDDAWAQHHLAHGRLRATGAVSSPAGPGVDMPVLPEPMRGLAPLDAGDAIQVLVVDDQEAMRRLIRRILQHAGFRCTTAPSGTEALQWFLSNPPPAAIVMDVLMPDVDGLEAVRHLRDLGFTGRIIMCTSLESAPVREAALRGGADLFLHKGRDLARLPALLKSVGVMPQAAAG